MTWERYKSNTTSFEVEVWIGKVFYIRSYCDDTSGTTYITKAPVCKLKMTPVVQFADTNIAWDISNSISATGTIDTFDIAWGGPVNLADLSGQSWAADPKTGNIQYTAEGTYIVTASVTDTLGAKSKEQKIEIRIIPATGFINLQRAYISTIDGGVFILEPGGVDPAASNTGLTSNHINIRAIKLHPAYKDLPSNQQHIWAATQDGVAFSTDGAENWTVISEATLGTPENAAGDGTPPTASDPDNIDIPFDPKNTSTIRLLRTTATRAWLYTSTDYGTTWTNEQISLTL